MGHKMKKIKLDKAEQEIENNYNKFKKINIEKRKHIEKIIDTANKKKIISLRLNNQDLNMIKAKAMSEGLPYQTLISSILHKYVTHKLIDEDNILNVIHSIERKK
jgi:predicted DNA binding CopG/RHH family protein